MTDAMGFQRWALSVAVVITTTGCTKPANHDSALPENAPNIVLLTVDTLRTDHMSAYGYARHTTPFFDSLARQGVLFERAYSTSSWTVPAVVSLVTGRNPAVHGVVFGAAQQNVVIEQHPIPTTLPTLPELLHESGYRTFGLTSNGHLLASLGFARGFDRYECLGFADAFELEVVFEQWLEEINNSGPYFLWLHFLDPHSPYRMQEPYFSEYWGNRQRHHELLGERAARHYDARGLDRQSDEVAFLKALYDSEIRRTDDFAQRMLSALSSQRQTLTIFTSDHGEEFLDHGWFGHGRTMYEESVRVPLIVVFPDAAHAGQRQRTPVSLLDVIPSLSDTLGLQWSAPLDGKSWMSLLTGAPHEADRDLFLSLSRGRELRAAISDKWKFVYDLDEPKKNELFELLADPRELRNMKDDDPIRTKQMKSKIIDHITAVSAERHRASPVQMTKEHTEQLRALGYLE